MWVVVLVGLVLVYSLHATLPQASECKWQVFLYWKEGNFLMGPMGNLDSVHLPKSLNSSCKCIILAKELSSIIIELVCSSGVHILLILILVGSIRFVFISPMYMEVFYVCIDGTSWECWLCSSLVVVWQTFSLCTFTSCLVDILSQALLAKQQ